MRDNGGSEAVQFVVKEPSPWWHRGAAVAAMVAFANAMGFLWVGRYWLTPGLLGLAALLAVMDASLNK